MEYSQKQYEEDCKFAKWTFKKYFRKNFEYREDLLQTAIFDLWRKRDKFDSSKCCYSTYAVSICYFAMLHWLKCMQRQTNDYSNLSLEHKLKNEEDAVALLDCISYDDDFESKLYYDKILSLCKKEILNHKSETFRKINLLYIDLFDMPLIAKKLNISKQCVNLYVHKLQKLMREKYSFEI